MDFLCTHAKEEKCNYWQKNWKVHAQKIEIVKDCSYLMLLKMAKKG